jgi:hypothetical protein
MLSGQLLKFPNDRVIVQVTLEIVKIELVNATLLGKNGRSLHWQVEIERRVDLWRNQARSRNVHTRIVRFPRFSANAKTVWSASGFGLATCQDLRVPSPPAFKRMNNEFELFHWILKIQVSCGTCGFAAPNEYWWLHGQATRYRADKWYVYRHPQYWSIVPYSLLSVASRVRSLCFARRWATRIIKPKLPGSEKQIRRLRKGNLRTKRKKFADSEKEIRRCRKGN